MGTINGTYLIFVIIYYVPRGPRVSFSAVWRTSSFSELIITITFLTLTSHIGAVSTAETM
jgi:hypothetical protein